MEELRKLEQVQMVLELLRSREVVPASSDPDADRFLSDLILLLVQPCGEIDIHGKCSLVKETIPKVSGAFLEEVQALLGREEPMKLADSSYQSNLVEGTSDDRGFQSFDEEADCRLLEENTEKEAMIGLDAMQRANSTLEDFCRSYFMFHGMDVNNPQSVFKYLPVLFFVESYIYQLDTLNEKIVNVDTGGETISHGLSKKKGGSGVFESNPFKPLMELMEVHGLLTERIREELKSGDEYWALERKLCCALNHNQEISVADVMRAIHLKSFDYRVMNLLLYQLRGETVDDLHMDFLSVSEFLVEVSDDLFDYEDDVLENTFNVLRMFVRIYGATAAPSMLAKCITEAEEKYDSLLKALEPQLSLHYQRRCEEATAEGGSSGGQRFGTWSIPPIIVDEESYRSSMLTDQG